MICRSSYRFTHCPYEDTEVAESVEWISTSTIKRAMVSFTYSFGIKFVTSPLWRRSVWCSTIHKILELGFFQVGVTFEAFFFRLYL